MSIKQVKIDSNINQLKEVSNQINNNINNEINNVETNVDFIDLDIFKYGNKRNTWTPWIYFKYFTSIESNARNH